MGARMIEDGDIGYLGNTHASFVARVPASVAGIKATVRGELACRSLLAFLHGRFPAAHESRAERRATAPAEFIRARDRVLRGA
jgi:hypothetical protein